MLEVGLFLCKTDIFDFMQNDELDFLTTRLPYLICICGVPFIHACNFPGVPAHRLSGTDKKQRKKAEVPTAGNLCLQGEDMVYGDDVKGKTI